MHVVAFFGVVRDVVEIRSRAGVGGPRVILTIVREKPACGSDRVALVGDQQIDTATNLVHL